MFRTVSIACAAALLMATAALADPIEGNWKTQSGATAAIRQACRQDDRLVQGRRRQQIYRHHHRPGNRQDLFGQGHAFRLHAEDERLRAGRPDLQEPDLDEDVGEW